MLLKRQDENNIINATYDSSNILASSYDTITNSLIITFKSGSKYKYTGVPKTDYTRFELAESQGILFNTHIKKYPTEKLDDVNPADMIHEAERLKKQEHEAHMEGKRKKLVRTMRQAILYGDAFPVREIEFQNELKTLYKEIEEYF